MKPSTKGFLLGLFAGVTLIVVVEVVGFFLLSLVAQKMMDSRGGFGRMALSEPRFPSADRLELHGAADESWVLTSLDGSELSFGELRGKTVFLNLWATWCGPCVMEMPAIESLYESVREDRNVALVLVSEEDPETVDAFARQQGWDLPLYVATTRPEVFRSRGVPATFVIDPEGAVVYRHIGAADWDSDGCRAFLSELSR